MPGMCCHQHRWRNWEDVNYCIEFPSGSLRGRSNTQVMWVWNFQNFERKNPVFSNHLHQQHRQVCTVSCPNRYRQNDHLHTVVKLNDYSISIENTFFSNHCFYACPNTTVFITKYDHGKYSRYSHSHCHMRFAETQPETELRFTTFKYDPQNWRLKTTVPKKSLKLCKIENVTSDKFWEKIRMKVLGWKVAELLRPIKTKIFDELNNKI